MDRTILHCDMNSFYASVELLEHPELKGKPVAVCGDPESRHGIILAKNEAAKGFGIKTAETIWQARRKCPELVLLPAHHRKYREASRAINAIYDQYTDLVEPFSIDESWLDVTGSLHLFGKDRKGLADEIRERVLRETGLTCSVGVSFNKVFAKLGSDYQKPYATTVILREDVPRIVWPLPVTDLLFVGSAAAKILRQYGILTIGQLARADVALLEGILGKAGVQMSQFARGEDRSPVVPAREQPPPKSIGNGITFRRNLLGLEEVRLGLELLSDSVASRLRRSEMKCTTLQITIRDPNFKTIQRQRGLSAPTNLARELTEAGLLLVRSCWNLTVPIRMLTVTALGLVPEWEAAEQLDLFAPASTEKREKLEALERTVDAIRSRYGRDAIQLGSLSGSELKGEGKPE